MQEQKMPPGAAFVMLAAFVLLGLASVSVWRWAIARWRRGEPALREAPRPTVPWGLIDQFGTGILFVVITVSIVQAILGATGERVELSGDISLDLQVLLLVADSLAKLATLAVTIVWLRVRFLRPWADLGWTGLSQTALKYGACGFVLTAAPVYAIQLVLTQFFPSKHPLIELLKDDPRPSFFLVCTFAAVVVAPLFEEYFFRVFFQGWLEKLARGRLSLETAIMGESRAEKLRELYQKRAEPEAASEPVLAEVATGPSEQSSANAIPAMVAAEDAENPYLPTVATTLPSTVPTGQAEVIQRSWLATWWPIIVSSLFFALAHFGHGPDPIPLFVLALTLGYLYQRTGSVWPGVIMHALFNAWSLGLLWLYVSAG